jgi:hypothetical protein
MEAANPDSESSDSDDFKQMYLNHLNFLKSVAEKYEVPIQFTAQVSEFRNVSDLGSNLMEIETVIYKNKSGN